MIRLVTKVRFLNIIIGSLLIYIFLLSKNLWAGDAELLFEAGNRDYLEGNYQEALNKWKQVEAMGICDAVLYYNLGNVYFKLDELGEAILYWEKASRQKGEDADIKANLTIARTKLVDKIEEQIRLPIWDWLDRTLEKLSASLLGWISILFSFLLFIILGINRWVIKSRLWIARGKWVAVVIVIILALNLALLAVKAHIETSNLHGVILSVQTEVLSAPTEGSSKLLFLLHEGTKVKVLRRIGEWYEISISKDKQGWVKSETLGII